MGQPPSSGGLDATVVATQLGRVAALHAPTAATLLGWGIAVQGLDADERAAAAQSLPVTGPLSDETIVQLYARFFAALEGP